MSVRPPKRRAVDLAGTAALALILVADSDQKKAASTNNAVAAGSLLTARTGACAANLQDGRVFITGGTNGTSVSGSAQIFDAKHGAVDAAQMAYPRGNHSCASLPDGRVLVAGGTSFGNAAINTAEAFDPSTAKCVTVGSMSAARSGA